jgi:hypothetical protein
MPGGGVGTAGGRRGPKRASDLGLAGRTRLLWASLSRSGGQFRAVSARPAETIFGPLRDQASPGAALQIAGLECRLPATEPASGLPATG